MRRVLLLGVLVTAGLAVVPASAATGSQPVKWRVTVENIVSGSQPMSPPIAAVHSSGATVWAPGQAATAAVAAVAEDANNPILLDTLAKLTGVHEVKQGSGAPIPPGQSATFEITSTPGQRYLSLVTMLVNTNDAFTGVHGLRLRNGATATVAYDAGTEVNNELASHIPGPCCNNPFVRDPEGELIREHTGITGAGDLDPAVYNWTGPVARITIERVG